MDASSSPVKRRAVLGSLDANAALTTPMASKVVVMGSPMLLTPSALLVSSPLPEIESASGKKKRAVEEDGSPVAKKTCVDGTTRSRSPSLETSSLFDTSAGDASWATATEPDAASTADMPPATRPRALTREQAREKAEILRLRLGLAGYKLRTGQTTIPLSELQRKPLPPSTTTTTRRRANTVSHAARTNTHTRVRSVDSIAQVPALSQESSAASTASDAMTVPASQESVVVETRGNTPDPVDSQGTAGEREKAILLPIGELSSPSKVFQSSPAPAPVSSLRSTCTD